MENMDHRYAEHILQSAKQKNCLSFVLNQIITDIWMEDVIEKAKKFQKYNAAFRDSNNCQKLEKHALKDNNYHRRFILVSGSQAEAMITPPIYASNSIELSDMDYLFVLGNFTITNFKSDRCTFVLDSEDVHAGYTRLQHFREFSDFETVQKPWYDVFKMVKVKENGIWDYSWVVSEEIAEIYAPRNTKDIENESLHGPALKTITTECSSSGHLIHESSTDAVPALSCKYWPLEAHEWATRSRGYWPSKDILIKIVKDGCHVVPVAHPKSNYPKVEWRFSFSKAEVSLCSEIPPSARKAYILFKLLCKYQLKTIPAICTYYLKTTMFWALEKTPDVFHKGQSNLSSMLFRLIDELLLNLTSQCIPNYFIRTNNLIDYLPHFIVQTALAKLQILKHSCPEVLFKMLQVQKLDTLPQIHDIADIFEPCLLKMMQNSMPIRDDYTKVIEKLSTAFYLEGQKYVAKDIVSRYFDLSKHRWILDADKVCQGIANLQTSEQVLPSMLEKHDLLESFFLTYSPNLTILWRKAHLKHCHTNRMLQSNSLNGEELAFRLAETLLSYEKALGTVESSLPTTNHHRFNILLHYTLFYLKYGHRLPLPDLLEDFHSVISQLEPSINVCFHMVDGPALPPEISRLLMASQVTVLNGKCLGFYLLFLARYQRADIDNVTIVTKELENECDSSDGDFKDGSSSLSADGRHYLLGFLYDNLGKPEQAAKHYYLEVIQEYLRKAVSVKPDDGFVYRLCVLGNCIVENKLFNCYQSNSNDKNGLADKILVYTRT